MPGRRPREDSWYFGPLPDLLLGCGGLYFVLFAVMVWQADALREAVPLGLLPLVVLVSGVPHYGATVVRVCERKADRQAYSRIAATASVVALAALAVGVRSAYVGSLLLTIYLTWSPWHYSGQNYGIALMFLRRRGVTVTHAAKRWTCAYFLLSFGLIALSIHAAVPGTDYAPINYQDATYERVSLGVPTALQAPAMVALAAGCALSLIVAGVLFWRQGASVADLLPGGMIALSQALWFAVPAIARFGGWFQGGGPLSAEYAVYAFVWIGVAHSVQYLWVTSYFAARSASAASARRSGFLALYGGRVLVAGAALWVLPALVFAPGLLGDVPFHDGLAALVAAVVNIHHFILDGVIWKLRDGRIARILVRRVESSEVAAPTAIGPKRSLSWRFIRGIAWVVGGACVAVHGWGELEYELGARAALERGDLSRARSAVERLSRIGRDGSAIRTKTGLLEAKQGDLEVGIADLERGVSLRETSSVFSGLAGLYDRAGRFEDAIAAYRRANALDPGSPAIANNLAWLLALRRSHDPGSVEEAIRLASGASSALGGNNATALDTLAVSYAAAGRFGDALQTGRRAIALARAERNTEQIQELAARQRGYRSRVPYRAPP